MKEMAILTRSKMYVNTPEPKINVYVTSSSNAEKI